MEIGQNKNELHLYPIDDNEYVGAINVDVGTTLAAALHTVVILDSSAEKNETPRFVKQILPLVASKLGYVEDYPIHVISYADQIIYKKLTVAELARSDLHYRSGHRLAPAIEMFRSILERFQRESSGTPIRVLTISDGRISDQTDADSETKKLTDFLATSDLTINSQAVRRFPSNHDKERKVFAPLLQINNTTTARPIDFNGTESNEQTANAIVAVLQLDCFQNYQTLQFYQSIILKYPWNSSSRQIILAPGCNIFWLKLKPKSAVKLGSDKIKVNVEEELTIAKFDQLMETKLAYIVDHMRILKDVGTTEANQTVDQIFSYFKKKEAALALKCSTPNNMIIANLLEGIAKNITDSRDYARMDELLRSTAREIESESQKESREDENNCRKREEEERMQKEEEERMKKEEEERIQKEEEERRQREEEEIRQREKEERFKREVEERREREEEEIRQLEKEERRKREEEERREREEVGRRERDEEERRKQEKEEKQRLEKQKLEAEEREVKLQLQKMLEAGELYEQQKNETFQLQNKQTVESSSGLQHINEKQESAKKNNSVKKKTTKGNFKIFTHKSHPQESRKSKISLITTAANKVRRFAGAVRTDRDDDVNSNPIQTVFILDENSSEAKRSWRFTEKIIPLVFSKISKEKSQLAHLLTVYSDTTPVVQMLQSLLQTFDASKRIRIFVLTIAKQVEERQDIESFAGTLIKFLNGSNFVYEIQIVRLASECRQSVLRGINSVATKYQLFDVDAEKSDASIATRIIELFNSNKFLMDDEEQLGMVKQNGKTHDHPTAAVSLDVDGKQSENVRTMNCEYCRTNIRKYHWSLSGIFLLIFAIPISLLLFNIVVCNKEKGKS